MFSVTKSETGGGGLGSLSVQEYMTSDEFIADAIARGQRDGITSLTPNQRMVFLISEAEIDCDMNGIDTFLNRYRTEWLPETAAAFAAVGATEIAAGFRAITAQAQEDEPVLDRLNSLITSRTGYDYESIRRAIENA